MNDNQLNGAKMDDEQKQVDEWIAQLKELSDELLTSCIQKIFLVQMNKIEGFFKILRKYFYPRFLERDEEHLTNYQPWFANILKDIEFMHKNADSKQVMASQLKRDLQEWFRFQQNRSCKNLLQVSPAEFQQGPCRK